MIWLAPALWLPSARADEPEYRAAVQDAVEAYTQQRYQEAFALFRKAHALQPSARTLRGLGLASFEIGRYADSMRYLTEALEDARAALTPAMRAEAERVLQTASAFVVRLHLELTPSDAELSVDGQVLEGAARDPVLLDPGVHQLVAKAKGFQVAVRSVQWPPGTQAQLELRLVPEVTNANGPPNVNARASDRDVSAQTVPTGRTKTRRFRVVKWVALATTLAALGVSGAAVGLREQRARAIARSCTGELSPDERDTCSQWYDSGHAWRTTSIITGAVGGALGVTTLVLFATDRSRESAARRAFGACLVGAGALQLNCRLTF